MTRFERAFLIGGSLLVAAQAVNLLLMGLFGAWVSGVVYVILIAAFATWHGMLRYGFWRVLAFGSVVTLVSSAYEICSILTGFPFGDYHYTDRFGPMIGMLPIAIAPIYFAAGYIGWAVAHALLSVHGGVLAGSRAITVPFVAALIMVMWHVPVEPIRATVMGLWVWHDGGPFFGTPITNIAGWFLCVWTFFTIFALMNRGAPAAGVPAIAERRFYWLLPVAMYASFPLENLGTLRRESIAVTSRDGHVWWTGDIYGSMAVIALLTILPVALNAAYRIFRDVVPDR